MAVFAPGIGSEGIRTGEMLRRVSPGRGCCSRQGRGHGTIRAREGLWLFRAGEGLWRHSFRGRAVAVCLAGRIYGSIRSGNWRLAVFVSGMGCGGTRAGEEVRAGRAERAGKDRIRKDSTDAYERGRD